MKRCISCNCITNGDLIHGYCFECNQTMSAQELETKGYGCKKLIKNEKECGNCGFEMLELTVGNTHQQCDDINTYTTMYKNGIKHDQGKSRLDLIPSEALEALGAVLTFGAKKYGDNNWQKGIKISRLIGAALRHWYLGKCKGEEYDKESGLPHSWHMFTNIMFIIWTEKNRPECDDIKATGNMSRVFTGLDGDGDDKK